MKKLALFIIAIMALPFLVKAQTDTLNYSTSTVYQNPYTWTEVQGNIALDDMLETVTYYDGLGRPIQSVAQRAGGNRENLVVPVVYDGNGRKPIDYLPLPVALTSTNEKGEIHTPNGASIPNDLQVYYKAKFPEDFYLGGGFQPDYDNPYSERVLEASPLSRVLEQGAPGFDWHADYSDHTIKFGYETNGSNEVYRFSVDFGTQGTDYTDPSLAYEGYYPADELYKNVTKDENWTTTSGNNHTVQEFTNKRGQVVLKRTFVDSQNVDTYYIYDDDGFLTYVLSPDASDQIIVSGSLASNSADILNDLCYQYKYDYRGRIFEKKIPGKGAETILYDQLDRPVLTQDAEQAKSNEWLFTKYDVLGRVAYTGILKNWSKSAAKSALATSPLYENRTAGTTTINGTPLFYSNLAFPQNDIEVHTVGYYDTYVDTGTLGSPPALNIYGTPITTDTQGLPTVSKVRVLDGLDQQTPSQFWITTVSGYDDKARPIHVMTENNYLNTKDSTQSDLDFTGKPIETRTFHEVTGISSNSITTLDYFTYDHAGRPIAHEQKIDNEPVQLIAKNYYDDLGQLYKKDVGGETFIDGYTDIENADVSFDGTITRNSGAADWNSGAKTKGEITADGGVRLTVPQNDKAFRFGLRNTLVLGSNGWDAYNYGLELNPGDSDGDGFRDVKVIINNAVIGVYGTFDTGDEFSVERVGTQILFKKNNAAAFYTHNLTSTVDLVGKVGLFSAGVSVEDFALFGDTIDKVLQEVDYSYNVRGWLTAINDVDANLQQLDLFSFRINYNGALEGNVGAAGVEQLFNGNISQTVWRTKNTDTQKRTYGYTYDAMNRLTNAYSRKGSTLIASDNYGVSGIDYDLNGNILQLNRSGANDDGTVTGFWDALTYTYDSGNQLLKVDDNGQTPALIGEGFNDGNTGPLDDYDYDDNGNMILDRNKDITNIEYNHFNLPETITGSLSQFESITYVYDATGIKLKKTVSDGSSTHTTKYANGYIYLDDELQFFSHPEGYVKPVSGTTEEVKGFKGGQTTLSGYQYVFQYVDHLGNVRLSYADADLNGSIATNEIIEESHYYPFGLKQNGYNNNISSDANLVAQQWKYAGKELNEDLGMDQYDFGARHYDASLGRWFVVDNLAELYISHSPYHYSANNPILFVDLDGNGFADAHAFLTGGSHGTSRTKNPTSAQKKGNESEEEEEGKEEESSDHEIDLDLNSNALASPIYDSDGNFMGTDSRGFQGEIIIMDRRVFDGLVSSVGVDGIIPHEIAIQFGNDISTITSYEAMARIQTHILANTGYNTSLLHNGSTSIYNGLFDPNTGEYGGYNNPSPNLRYSGGMLSDGSIRVTTNITYWNELYTVELVQSYLGEHEFTGHGRFQIKGAENHYKAYELQLNHSTYNSLPAGAREEIYSRYHAPRFRPPGYKPPKGWIKI